MKTLVLGAGNLLLSDEGFGVHFIQYLQSNHHFPSHIALLDIGTAGLAATWQVEEAERVYLIDALADIGPPGTQRRFSKNEFLWKQISLRLSPHQIGVREMLLMAEMRGRCPEEIHVIGVVPQSLEPGTRLTPLLENRLRELAAALVLELEGR